MGAITHPSFFYRHLSFRMRRGTPRLYTEIPLGVASRYVVLKAPAFDLCFPMWQGRDEMIKNHYFCIFNCFPLGKANIVLFFH